LPLATVFVNPDVPLVPLPVPDDFRAHRWSSGSDRSDPERGPEQPERKRPELKYGISQPVDSLSLSGAGNGSRTRDPQLGKEFPQDHRHLILLSFSSASFAVMSTCEQSEAGEDQDS